MPILIPLDGKVSSGVEGFLKRDQRKSARCQLPDDEVSDVNKKRPVCGKKTVWHIE